MPSFDIVSEVDNVEIRNAVDNANRELTTRFDFRGVEAEFVLNGNDLTLSAQEPFQLNQMEDILRSKLAKRDVDPRSFKMERQDAEGRLVKRKATFLAGIETAFGKEIVKLLKDSKIKVQASIQGEQVRVTGKNRDDLQAAIAFLREKELQQPLQFKNFRD